MKRVMFAAMLLVSTVTVFATETKGKDEQVNRKEFTSTQKFDECEVSIGTKIGPSFAQIEVKCSYKAATCKEAISNVAQCLKDAKAAVMQ